MHFELLMFQIKLTSLINHHEFTSLTGQLTSHTPCQHNLSRVILCIFTMQYNLMPYAFGIQWNEYYKVYLKGS